MTHYRYAVWVVALCAGWWGGLAIAARADASHVEAARAAALLTPPPATYTLPDTLPGRVRVWLAHTRADVASAHARGGWLLAPLNLWSVLAGERLIALRLPTVAAGLVLAACLAGRWWVWPRWSLAAVTVGTLALAMGLGLWPRSDLAHGLERLARARPASAVVVSALPTGSPAMFHARHAGLLRGPVLHLNDARQTPEELTALAARFNGPAEVWLLLPPDDQASAAALAWRTTLGAHAAATSTHGLPGLTVLVYPGSQPR